MKLICVSGYTEGIPVDFPPLLQAKISFHGLAKGNFMRFGILVLAGLVLSGCRHAALLPQEPEATAREAGLNWLKTQQQKASPCTGMLEVQGIDQWSSRILRWFTPLTQNRSSFLLREAGADSAVTLPDQEPLKFQDQDLSTWDRIYIEPLQLYVRLPQWIAAAHNPVSLGLRTLGEKKYQAVFFTLKPGSWNDPELDQYIAYFTEEDSRLALLQFTYRDLASSYVGWLSYGPPQAFSAFPYPSRIQILDDWSDNDAVHTIELENIRCIPGAS